MIKDSFLLAIKNLRKRKLRSWLTMLGIVIGIAAVVALISLGQGLRTAINSQFGNLATDTLTIQNKGTGFGPPGSTAIAKLTSHDVKIVESVSGVKVVVPRLIRISSVEYNNVVSYNYLASVPADKDKIAVIEELLPETQEGRLLKANDKGKVVLGSDFSLGKQFELLFGKEIRVGSKIKIKDKDFEVIGILKPSSSFVVNIAVLMPEEDMKSLLGIQDEVDIIAARVDEKNIDSIALNIKDKLRRDRHEKIGEESFDVQTPLQAISAVNTILTIVNIIVAGIAAISLLIGGLGVMNTMYTSVLERTREIGTMKAIGARNSDILTIFLIESGLLGLVGGLIGAIIGSSMALSVSRVANQVFGENIFAVSISSSIFGGAVLFSFLLGIFSGVLPAYQASRLNPVEALRR